MLFVCLFPISTDFGFLRTDAAGASQYTCPNDKYGQYRDNVQCDKYYECVDGISTVKICPDGLVFDESIRLKNKCDQPFNVDCEDRVELRKCLQIATAGWSRCL